MCRCTMFELWQRDAILLFEFLHADYLVFVLEVNQLAV